MNILEKRSKIRVNALKNQVERKEYSPEYALERLDQMNLKGMIIATDFEETFDWLADQMNFTENYSEEIEEDVIIYEPDGGIING